MRFVVGDPLLFVGVDALVEFDEAVTEFTDGPAGEVAKITLGEAGVLAAEFHLACEGHVIADENLGPCHHGSRESFVVTVTQANDPPVVSVLMPGELEFEDSEVAGTIVAEGVGLAAEDKSSAAQLVFGFGEEVPVRHGIPSLGVGRCGHFEESVAGDQLSSAMEKEAGWTFFDGFCFCFGFNEVIHEFCLDRV